MKKENFCKLIQAVEKQLEREQKFTELISKYFDGHMISEISSPLIGAAISALEDETGDIDVPEIGSTISWWLFVNPSDRHVLVDDGWISVDDPGKLFDLLCD